MYYKHEILIDYTPKIVRIDTSKSHSKYGGVLSFAIEAFIVRVWLAILQYMLMSTCSLKTNLPVSIVPSQVIVNKSNWSWICAAGGYNYNDKGRPFVQKSFDDKITVDSSEQFNPWRNV